MPYTQPIDELLADLQQQVTDRKRTRRDLNKILKFAMTNLPEKDLIKCIKGEFHQHTLNEIADAIHVPYDFKE
jgi:hypothetical protein